MNDTINDIEFGDTLSIAQVGDLYGQLLKTIADEKAINLDLSHVERVDTAAIQLLYSFQREAIAQGIVIIWSNPSKVFCDAVDILDVPAFYRES